MFLTEQFEFLQKRLESMIPPAKKAFLQQFYSQVWSTTFPASKEKVLLSLWLPHWMLVTFCGHVLMNFVDREHSTGAEKARLPYSGSALTGLWEPATDDGSSEVGHQGHHVDAL